MNFIGLVVENLIKFQSDYFYKNILKNILIDKNKRRFECLLACPLLMFSAVSNFYFFADEEIGNIYAWKMFQGT